MHKLEILSTPITWQVYVLAGLCLSTRAETKALAYPNGQRKTPEIEGSEREVSCFLATTSPPRFSLALAGTC